MVIILEASFPSYIVYVVLKLPVLFLLQITMWDLQSGKLLRSITDAHPMGSAVLHVMVRKGGGGCCV